MKELLIRLLSRIASLIPTTNIIVFQSSPDYSDNAFAMCKYLNAVIGHGNWRYVWIIVDWERKGDIEAAMKMDGIKASLVKHQSLNGIWSFVRARYIFNSHGLYDNIRLHQHNDKNICLWHGMPLKRIGAGDSTKSGGGRPCSTNFDYVISSSKMFQRFMAESFATQENKVLVTGQPRCDMLFESTEWFDNMGIDKNKYSRIGIWMPTFRKSIRGEVRIDGQFNEHGVSFLDEQDIDRLDKALAESNTLLLLKIHPMDALQNATFKAYSNIIIIKPRESTVPLYPLLGSCDFLLTDYSSVFVDYQILHRPIGFVMNDIDAYKKSRGVYINDLENSLPGPILSTVEQVLEFVKCPFVVDKDINYNDYFDNHSSERICKILNII